MRKPIKTKEMYVKEVQSLTERLNTCLSEDTRLRDEFSGILGNPQPTMWGGTPRLNRMSWEEIFFRIGELRADANYSCVISSRDSFRDELFALKESLKPKEPKL